MPILLLRCCAILIAITFIIPLLFNRCLPDALLGLRSFVRFVHRSLALESRDFPKISPPSPCLPGVSFLFIRTGCQDRPEDPQRFGARRGFFRAKLAASIVRDNPSLATPRRRPCEIVQ